MSGPLRAERKRILIVDDHPLVRSGLRELLAHEPDVEVCGEAEDVHGGLKLVEQLLPDLVIVDLSLRGGSGLELLKRIRVAHPQARMIVASMHDDADFADRALSAGAMGYVSKHEPVETILEAIRRVLSGRVYLSPTMVERAVQRAAGRPRPLGVAITAALTDRELEVFEAVGRGHSTRQIAEHLRLSVKTIETHRENIKRKLGLANNADLIRRSWQWVLEERSSEG